MSKTVKKSGETRGGNNNPEGKGGFGESRRPGPGRGHKKPVPSTGNRIVDDMNQAYTTAEVKGEPQGVSEARRLLKEDYGKFMMIYVKAGGRGTPEELTARAEGGFVEVGEKEELVEELAERLLREWEVEDAQRA